MLKLKIVIVALCLLSLSACGGSRQMGDLGGVPVEFEVLLERPFVAAMENRQARLGASLGASVGSHGSSTGLGFGLSFQSTNVYLYGGDKAGQANVFRKKLKWGDNHFTIPMNPKRKLVFSVVVSGGRSGWEAVGEYTVTNADNAVRVLLSETGAEIETVAD